MELVLNLNLRLQPMHRHHLEDELQEILEKEELGEVTGGGTLLDPQTGEIISCDIQILLNEDKKDTINHLVELINKTQLYTLLYQRFCIIRVCSVQQYNNSKSAFPTKCRFLFSI